MSAQFDELRLQLEAQKGSSQRQLREIEQSWQTANALLLVEIATLRAKLEAANGALEEPAQELSGARQEIERITLEKRQSDILKDQLTEWLEALQASYDALNAELTTVTQEKTQLQQYKDTADNALKTNRDDILRLQEKNASKQTQLDTMGQALQILTQDIGSVKEQNEKIKQALAQKTALNETLTKQRDELQTQLNGLRDESADANQKLARLEQARADADLMLQEAKTFLKQAEADLTIQSKANLNLLEEIDALRKSRQESGDLERRHSIVKEELAQQVTLNETLTKQRDELQAQVKGLQDESAKTHQRIAELEQARAAAEHKLGERMVTIALSEAIINSQRTELQDRVRERQELLQKQGDDSREFAKLRDEYASQQRELETEIAKNIQLEQSLTDALDELQRVRDVNAALLKDRPSIEEVEKQLPDLRTPEEVFLKLLKANTDGKNPEAEELRWMLLERQILGVFIEDKNKRHEVMALAHPENRALLYEFLQHHREKLKINLEEYLAKNELHNWDFSKFPERFRDILDEQILKHKSNLKPRKAIVEMKS